MIDSFRLIIISESTTATTAATVISTAAAVATAVEATASAAFLKSTASAAAEASFLKASATASAFFRTGFINYQVSAVNFASVKLSNGCLGLFVIWHFNKT